MTDQQVKDVRDLTRAAKISPTTTKVSGPGHPVLAQLAPGERVLVPGGLKDDRPARPEGQASRSGGRGNGGGGGGRRRGGRSGERSNRPQGEGRSSQRRSRGGSSQSRGSAAGGGHSAADFSGRRRGR
jgi:hypothetical protein